MNIILFKEEEWGKPLAYNDYRSVHIRNQLKLRRGDSLRVGLINRGVGWAEVLSAPSVASEEHWDKAKGESTEPTASEPNELTASEPNQCIRLRFPERLYKRQFPCVHAIIGHPRPTVFRRLLSDLAGLGISSISFVRSELCEKSYLASSVWAGVEGAIVRGLEQGGHSSPPQVNKFYSLRKCLSNLPTLNTHSKGSCLVALHPDVFPNAPLNTLVERSEAAPRLQEILAPPRDRPYENFVIAIGPDRGWTAQEIKQFESKGFLRSRLGASILRTETAAILALGMAMVFGETSV